MKNSDNENNIISDSDEESLNRKVLWRKIARELIELYEIAKEIEKENNTNSQFIPPIYQNKFIYDRSMLKQIAKNNNLRKIRIEKRLTQKQVASLLGLKCEDRLSHWERGSSVPSLENLMKLCEVYEISAEKLYKL